MVAAVLIYGSESWNLALSEMWVLEGFHVEAARQLAGMRSQQRKVEPWIYPKSKDVLRAAQLRTIGYYVRQRRHNTTKTIEGWTLLEECRGAEM